MSWFKVDDLLFSHPKWCATPVRSRALWVTAGSWASSRGNGGHVPASMLGMLGGTRRDATALVEAGLWEVVDGGWTFHDWDQFQPTASAVRAKKEAESAGGSFGNHKRWHTDKGVRVEGCRHCEQFDEEVSGTRSGTRSIPESGANRPDPARPDPSRPDPILGSPSVTGSGNQIVESSSSIVTLVTRDQPVDNSTTAPTLAVVAGER